MFRTQLTVWPAHPKPKEGELLSSWITRIARANHLATADFSKIVLPDKRTTLKEIDRTYSPETMQVLADGTGVPIERAWETSLLSDEGYVFSYRPYGTTEWILPTVAVDGIGGKGMAYCPQCLASDAEPYYRKSWRYVFSPVCPTHRAFLRHGCPSCGKPYNFFYDSSAQSTMANPMATCRWCGADMRHVPPSQDNSALIDGVLAIQVEINAGIARDLFTVDGYGHVHAQPYLKALHACMNSLTDLARAKWVVRNYREELPKGMDVAALERKDYVFVIELRSIEEIGILLCLADVLMKDWPDRFMRYTRKHEISPRTYFTTRVIPYWVTKTAREFFVTTAGGFSKDEIENAKRHLRRKLERPESGNELKIFMTQGVVRNLAKVSSEARKQIELSPEQFDLKQSGQEENPLRKRSDKWKRLVESADHLTKIAVLRKTRRKPVQDSSAQLDLFGRK